MCCAEESNAHAPWYSHNGGIRDLEEKNCWIKLFLFLLHTKNILTALWNCGTTDVIWTILSMEHSSCIAVYAGPESSRICAFGMTLGRVINARIVIFGRTNPLKQTAINHSTFFHVHCILPTIVVTLTEELQKAEEITSELVVSHDLLTYAKEGNMWQHITYRWTCCDTDHRFSVAAIWLELNS